MGQVGQMLSQNNFLGGLGSLEGSFLIGFASIIFSLAIAVIPFMAKRIVSGDVGSTAGVLIGAAVTALTAGTAAIEGAAVGAAAAGAGGMTGANGNASNGSGAVAGGAKMQGSVGAGNQPVPGQRGINSGDSSSSAGNQPAMDTKARNTSSAVADGTSQTDEAEPTAEGHAGQIRSSMMSVAGQEEHASEGEESAGAEVGSNSGAGPASSPSGSTFASANRGNPWSWRLRAPNPRLEGLATWGAYHAARLATKAAVTGTRATGNAGRESD